MRFITLLSLVASLMVARSAFAGGPDVRCRAATIETVVTDESKVVMIISGRCELFLSDAKLPPNEGSAKFVATDLQHCVVTLVRRNEALEGMGFHSWAECCEKARAQAGKTAWLDLQGSATIDSASVVSVRATAYGFGTPEASAGPAAP